MLSISLLRIFISVAENSSFTRAAGEMYRSQSAISMQIKRLEDILRTPVFERSGKTVELTPAGVIFLDYAQRIIRLADEAISAVHIMEHAAPVRLGCIEDYAGRAILPTLKQFWTEQPQVQITVRTGETAYLLDRLGIDFDMVITAHEVGTAETELTFRDKMVWAASIDNSPHTERPLPIAIRSDAELDRQWAAGLLDDVHISWRHTFSPSGIGTLQSAVEDGLAIGVFKAGTLPANLRILTENDGLPELPGVDIALHISAEAAQRTEVRQLADALSEALDNISKKVDRDFNAHA